MRRIEDRVAIAIERASSRYFDSLVFTDGDACSRPVNLHAVRRNVAAEEYSTIDAATTARVLELIVSRREFLSLFKKKDQNKLEVLRKGRLTARCDNQTIVYRFNHKLPYVENTPDGSSFRLFVYEASK